MHTDLADVPRPVDGVIAFFDFSALEARAAFPDVPLLEVSHGPWYSQDAPTALVEPCAAIALSDPSLGRLQQSAMADAGSRSCASPSRRTSARRPRRTCSRTPPHTR